MGSRAEEQVCKGANTPERKINLCFGLTPASSQVPHSHSLTSPPAELGRELEGEKSENSRAEIKTG